MRVGLVFALVAFAPPALAQVDIEPLRAKLPDNGVGGIVDARVNGRGGNTDGLTAGTSAVLGARSEPHTGLFAASGDYAKFDGEVEVARYFGHLRYAYTIIDHLWGEAFTQLEHDRFAKLVQRRLLGAGPRWRALQTGTLQLFLSTAYMLEWETLDDTVPRDERDILVHRSSNGIVAIWEPDDRVLFSTSLLFQPRFDEPADYRVLSTSTARFAITKVLEASLAVKLRQDSEPPPGVEKTDYEINNQLGVRF